MLERLKRKRKTFFALLLLFVSFGDSQAEWKEIGDVIAYPNPFNPVTDILTIKPADAAVFDGTVRYIVYNYHQQEIYSGSAVQSAIVWGGYTQSGNKIAPGIYFIKLILTGSDNTTGTKMIKVIIQ